MKSVYCTLFDSNYSDKGLVMIESFRNYSNCEIYVLCMDDLCYKIITETSINSVYGIELSEFMDDDLAAIKDTRKWGEFCWTCTAKLIKYILTRFDTDICTYVDSDLMFYSAPDILIDEMIQYDCLVQVVPHRFPNTHLWQEIRRTSGDNCVQFNTFSNKAESLELLDHWIDQTLDECSVSTGGDQKYTSEWGNYSFVHICQHEGAGIAPWNAQNYCVKNNNPLRVMNRKKKTSFDVIFFHFQGMEYINRYTVNIKLQTRVERIDKRFILELYIPYIKCLEEKKKYLKDKYGIDPIYSHSNALLSDVIPKMSFVKRVIYEFWMIGWGHRNIISIADERN